MYGGHYQTSSGWQQQLVNSGADYLARGAGALLSNVVPGIPSDIHQAFTSWPTTGSSQWPGTVWQQPRPLPRAPDPPVHFSYQQSAERLFSQPAPVAPPPLPVRPPVDLGAVSRLQRDRREGRLVSTVRDMLTSVFEKVLTELRVQPRIQRAPSAPTRPVRPPVSVPHVAVIPPPGPAPLRTSPSRRAPASGPPSFLDHPSAGYMQGPSPAPPTICETHIGTEFPAEERVPFQQPSIESLEALAGFDSSSPRPVPRVFSSISEDETSADLRVPSADSREILVTPLTFNHSSQVPWPESPETAAPRSPVRNTVTTHRCPMCHHEFVK